MAYGLKPKEVEKILAVLSKHPQVNKAVLYGSRALGTHHKGSDIDLTLLGKELKFPELARIETELDDLLLPYQIDLSIYHQIDNDSLLNHIERVGVVFFERDGQPNKKKN